MKFEAAQLPGLGIAGLMRSWKPGDGWIPRPGLGISNIPLSWKKISPNTGEKAKECCTCLFSVAGRGSGPKKFYFQRVWTCKNPVTGDETLAYIYTHCSAHYDIVIRDVNHVRLHLDLCNSDLEDEVMFDLEDLQMRQQHHGEPCASPSRIVQQRSRRPTDETTAPWKLPLHLKPHHAPTDETTAPWKPHDLRTIRVLDVQHQFLEHCSHAWEWWSEHSVMKVLLGGKALTSRKLGSMSMGKKP